MRNPIIRKNLMSDKMYRPYCGNNACNLIPRTRFNGEQFTCPLCGWTSAFDVTFMTAYKMQWHLPPFGNRGNVKK